MNVRRATLGIYTCKKLSAQSNSAAAHAHARAIMIVRLRNLNLPQLTRTYSVHDVYVCMWYILACTTTYRYRYMVYSLCGGISSSFAVQFKVMRAPQHHRYNRVSGERVITVLFALSRAMGPALALPWARRRARLSRARALQL